MFSNIFNNQMKQTLNTMKKVFLTVVILLQLFNNFAICGTISSNESTSFGDTKNIISKFFDVIRSVVDLSGLGNSIKNRVDDKKEEPVNSDKGIYLVITLNNISSLTIIFLQSMLVFLGFVNLLKVRGCKVGGRRYILMFLLFLPLSMYKFVYYAPRSSISDCVIYLISGVLISSRVGGMKLGSYRRDGGSRKLSRLLRDRRDGCVDDIKHSYLLFANHQTLISNTYFLTPNYKPLVPNICRFNSASWFFTPYHPLVPALTFREYGINPPYHEAGLNLQKKSGVRNQRLGNKGFVAVAFMRPRKLRGAINRTATENETPQIAGRPRVGSGY
jgi:hypothetical protein